MSNFAASGTRHLVIRHFFYKVDKGFGASGMKKALLLLTLLLAVVFCYPQKARADLLVRDVHSTGVIDSLADVDALLGGSGIASETTVTENFVDYLDIDGGGGTGHFGNNLAFPNDTPGSDDNDFAIHVTGQICIVNAGDWTFGVSSDDGSRLRINGANLIVDDSLHAVQDRFATINLSAGWHNIDFVFFERGGGAGVELFASQGSFSSFAGNNFRLVGDVANGGLKTTPVPEPNAICLLGLVLTGMMRRRKR